MSITGILTFVFVLTVLVFFHELGHFLFAKLFRMHVEEFAIGFGPRALRVWHDGETEYNIRWIPAGGFVRIKGMEIEEATEKRLTGAEGTPQPGVPGNDAAGIAGQFNANSQGERIVAQSFVKTVDDGFTTTNAGTMAQEVAEVDGADADGFNNRPISQRFWVIFGGPLFSFVFGWLMFCLAGATFGVPDPSQFKQSTVIEQVVPDKPAARAGIRAGDTVLAINDKPVSDGKAMVEAIHASPGTPITVSVRTKKNETRTVTVTPESLKDAEQPGKTIGIIGIQPTISYGAPKRLSVSESFAYGNEKVAIWFQMMGRVLTNFQLFGQSVGGPVEILKASTNASQDGATHVVLLIAQLSLSLGLFNLFPIPVLDGGHLALMALEAVRRRKLTAEQTGRVFMVGFVFIASVAAFILLRGVYRWIFN